MRPGSEGYVCTSRRFRNGERNEDNCDEVAGREEGWV